jgi:hypothetical protein
LRQNFQDALQSNHLELQRIGRRRYLRTEITGIQPPGGRLQLYEGSELSSAEYSIYICYQWPEFINNILGVFFFFLLIKIYNAVRVLFFI